MAKVAVDELLNALLARTRDLRESAQGRMRQPCLSRGREELLAVGRRDHSPGGRPKGRLGILASRQRTSTSCGSFSFRSQTRRFMCKPSGETDRPSAESADASTSSGTSRSRCAKVCRRTAG